MTFPINFSISFSLNIINLAGFLIGVALNLYISLGRIGIFTMLHFSVDEHNVCSFYLVLQFLSSMFCNFSIKFCTHFVNYIHNYLILFRVIINSIAYLILGSIYSLLVYRSVIDVCMLILLNSCILGVFVDSLEFSM